MALPNEIIDKVFLLSESKDIQNWEHYGKLSRTTFLKKKDKYLSHAACCGNLIGVKYLVTAGADIHANHDEALRNAAWNGHLEVVKYLVTRGADVHAWDNRALRLSAHGGHLEVVEYLVEETGALDDWALVWAAVRGHLDIVKHLHEAGADIHIGDDDALIRAAACGHLEVVKYLVTVGVDFRTHNVWALIWAAEHGHLEVVKYLHEAGWDIDAREGEALKCAIRRGHLEIANYLMSKKGGLPPELIIRIYNFCDDFREVARSLDIFPYLEKLAIKKYKIQEEREEEANMRVLVGDETVTLTLYKLISNKEDFHVIKLITKHVKPPRYYYDSLLTDTADLDTFVLLYNYFIKYINRKYFWKYNREDDSKFTRLSISRKINGELVKFLSKHFN